MFSQVNQMHISEAIWGFVGVVVGSIVSGLFNICAQKQNNKYLQENLSMQLQHSEKIDQYKLMIEAYKFAIDSAIDCMKAQWFKKANPGNNGVDLHFVESWMRTWKACGQLSIFLPTPTVREYEKLVTEMQCIELKDLEGNVNDHASIEAYDERIKPFRDKVETILKPLKDLMKN